MKIKLRYQNTTITVDFEDQNSSSLTLAVLRSKIIAETRICGDFHLSLNNNDIIEAEDGAYLADLGIVAGDLLFIVTSQQDALFSKADSTGADRPQGHRTNPHLFEDISTDISDCMMAEDIATDTADCAMAEDVSADTSNENKSVAAFDPVVNKCLCEPLLCCEATSAAVPATLSHLFTISACTCKEEALWIVIHTMMLESGYQLMQDAQSDPSDYLCLPDGWKSVGFYRFQYTHAHAEDLLCSVTGVPMGNSLVIHGLVEGSSKFHTQQLQLKTQEFVTDDLTGAAQCYRSLDRLSRCFKDRICLPLVNAVRAELGLEDSEGLLALTHELKLKVFSYLDADSLLKIDETCRQCHAVARDSYLWRRLYLRDFGRTDDLSLSRSWYNLYRREYKKKEERRKALSRTTFITPDLLWDQRQLLPQFPSLYPPHGIIGGDYDLDPQFYGISDPGQVPHILPRPRFDPFGPSSGPQLFPPTGRRGGLPHSKFGRFGDYGHRAGPRFF